MLELSWRAGGNRILIDLVVLRGGDPADMTSIPARALLDTGATVSGIGPRIVQALDLSSHSKKRLKSATEEAFVDYYLFRIGFHVGNADLGDALQLPFVFDASDGFSWARSADFDVILGMDVLKQCDFTRDRTGRCTLRFG
jgi:hypothetical protein